jgi:uncharacterized membrane protein
LSPIEAVAAKVGLAGSIAVLEFATKIVWYYLHERVWAAAPGDDANCGDNPWPHPDDER